MRILSALLFLTLAGCLPKAYSYPTDPAAAQAAQQQAVAEAMGKPSHAPTTDSQWSAAEADAQERARSQDMESIAAPVRVVAQGYSAEHRFNVEGGKCYAAGIGWAYSAITQASVYFQARPDGQLVNDSVGGANQRLEPNAGVLTFCADRDGEALLSLSALKPDGSMAMNELLEYAFVLGSKTETAAAAKVRREKDAQAGAQARARQEQNIAEAKAREARNLAERCRRCREEFRLCQVEAAYARKHPRAGVSYTKSCESQFGICATGKYSGTQEEMAQCGAPPL